LTAHVSAIFLLPVFEKSVIFNDFRASAHIISAREGGNTVWWKAIARKRTVDNSVTYWFPWKHYGETTRAKICVFDQTPRIWARRLDPLSSVKLPQPKHRLGPSGLYLYLYLFFGVDDSIVDDFTQRGDHSSGPMRNPKLTGMVPSK